MSALASPAQAAVFAILNADATLTGTYSVQDIADRIPQDTAYPFIYMGEITSDQADTFSRNGELLRMNIHTYTQSGGQKDAQDIAARIHTLLHGISLSISGWQRVYILQRSSSIIQEPDGITFHAVQRFEIHALDT